MAQVLDVAATQLGLPGPTVGSAMRRHRHPEAQNVWRLEMPQAPDEVHARIA